MLEKLTAMEIIELMEQLESIEPLRKYIAHTDEQKNIKDMIDCIFYKAFGFDWYRNSLYKELRKIIPELMELKEDLFTKGYYQLISK